jgi:hypothetical protein
MVKDGRGRRRRVQRRREGYLIAASRAQRTGQGIVGGGRVRLTCLRQKSRESEARGGYVGESVSSSGNSRLGGDYV